MSFHLRRQVQLPQCVAQTMYHFFIHDFKYVPNDSCADYNQAFPLLILGTELLYIYK